MVAPDNEAQPSDSRHRVNHRLVTEDWLTNDTGEHVRNHTHSREKHDVHSWMGIKPK